MECSSSAESPPDFTIGNPMLFQESRRCNKPGNAAKRAKSSNRYLQIIAEAAGDKMGFPINAEDLRTLTT